MRIVAYRYYLVIVLLIIYAFNAVDSLALGLLLQNIKVDLHLSDTQLGFLSGIAFALFYSLLGIPIARRADRGNRVTIIALTTALWSLMMALCGTAGSFAQLLLIRVGVAVGEAGCVPTAHSLIAAYFARAERPRAVAIYMLGGSLSVVVGYFVAGWLNQLYGWRATFILLGLPGLLISVLAWLTLKEPRRERGEMAGANTLAMRSMPDSEATELSEAPPTLRVVWSALWSNRTFRHLLFCFSVVSFFGSGIGRWLPSFFIRSYGMKTGELGTWFAVVFGLGGMVGLYLGGEWASRCAANNERLQLKAMAIGYSIFGVISSFVYLSHNKYMAFGLMALATAGGATVAGPLFATIQTLVPERMRATSIALLYLFANLIGLGLGPLVAGVLSDALRPWAGEESLRYALLVLCPGYLWGAWHVWQASRTVTRDLEATQIDQTTAASNAPKRYGDYQEERAECPE